METSVFWQPSPSFGPATAKDFRGYLNNHRVPTCGKLVISSLWEAETSVQKITCHQCAFGTRWRKATSFLCGNMAPEDLTKLSKTCGGRRTCVFTGKPHIVLQGSAPNTGVRWTAIAAAYPTKLCRVLASLLVQQELSNHYNITSSVAF